MVAVPSLGLGPIETGALSFVRVGAAGRAPFVTVVARARFRIVPGEAMRAMPAAPLARRPAYAADGRLIEPGDFAPYLPSAEILVFSTAPVAEPRPARFMITRQGAKLYAKSLTLESYIGLGAVLRTPAPDPDGPLLELPEGFDFRAYHAAPADQILEFFRGGESVVLEGIAPRFRRLQTWVPLATPTARLYARGGGPLTAPFALAMDRFVLELDTLTASLTMRACVPVATEGELATLGAVAAYDATTAQWPARFEALG